MVQRWIDRPDVLSVLFHPRRSGFVDPAAPSGHAVSLAVEDGVRIGGVLYPAKAPNAPLILYFHGNGEVAQEYGPIWPFYARAGASLLVMDYRGYGASGGVPTSSSLLSDASAVYRGLPQIIDQTGIAAARTFVMGRSLGSAAALQVAVDAADQIGGIIIESGFADTFGLIRRLGGPEAREITDAEDGFGNLNKIAGLNIPTLIIHGDQDWIIPVDDGLALHGACQSEEKRLVVIRNAGHNDLIMVGLQAYFGSIAEFIGPSPSG